MGNDANAMLVNVEEALRKLDLEMGNAAMAVALLRQSFQIASSPTVSSAALEKELVAALTMHDDKVSNLAFARISVCIAVAMHAAHGCCRCGRPHKGPFP